MGKALNDAMKSMLDLESEFAASRAGQQMPISAKRGGKPSGRGIRRREERSGVHAKVADVDHSKKEADASRKSRRAG